LTGRDGDGQAGTAGCSSIDCALFPVVRHPAFSSVTSICKIPQAFFSVAYGEANALPKGPQRYAWTGEQAALARRKGDPGPCLPLSSYCPNQGRWEHLL